MGGTIHEVAQVVAVPASVPGAPVEMADAAVIVKMTRVIMIAPMLIVLGFYLAWDAKRAGGERNEKTKLVIPWFAVYFIMVAGFNSFHLIPQHIVDVINEVDTFLLTMAMTALGMGTIFSKFKGLGPGTDLYGFDDVCMVGYRWLYGYQDGCRSFLIFTICKGQIIPYPYKI